MTKLWTVIFLLFSSVLASSFAHAQLQYSQQRCLAGMFPGLHTKTEDKILSLLTFADHDKQNFSDFEKRQHAEQRQEIVKAYRLYVQGLLKDLNGASGWDEINQRLAQFVLHRTNLTMNLLNAMLDYTKMQNHIGKIEFENERPEATDRVLPKPRQVLVIPIVDAESHAAEEAEPGLNLTFSWSAWMGRLLTFGKGNNSVQTPSEDQLNEALNNKKIDIISFALDDVLGINRARHSDLRVHQQIAQALQQERAAAEAAAAAAAKPVRVVSPAQARIEEGGLRVTAERFTFQDFGTTHVPRHETARFMNTEIPRISVLYIEPSGVGQAGEQLYRVKQSESLEQALKAPANLAKIEKYLEHVDAVAKSAANSLSNGRTLDPNFLANFQIPTSNVEELPYFPNINLVVMADKAAGVALLFDLPKSAEGAKILALLHSIVERANTGLLRVRATLRSRAANR